MFNKLLSILYVFIATGSIVCMDKPTIQRLNFLLDKDLVFLSSSTENMSYLEKPADFIGKNICEVLNLSTTDWLNLAAGFSKAQHHSTTTRVPYTLKGQNFLAKITALKKADTTHEFFVKVTPQ